MCLQELFQSPHSMSRDLTSEFGIRINGGISGRKSRVPRDVYLSFAGLKLP